MNQRIRYFRPTNGVMVSRRLFTTSSGIDAQVELNANTLKYRILDAGLGTVIAEGGDTVNLAVLKIQAKVALVALGVNFEDEVRVRGAQESA